MPSLKTIRKRIASTKATQKITRAMKMVAGARLTRAQQRIVSMRPYALKTSEVLHNVALAMQQAAGAGDGVGLSRLHPLLAQRPEKKVLFVVMTSDRGLCGAFNTNINKATERAWRQKQEEEVDVAFLTIGRKGREYLARRRGQIAFNFTRVYEQLDLERARGIGHWIISRYLPKDDQPAEYDSVYLVYNEFKSAISQKVTVERLLPLEPPQNGGAGEHPGASPTSPVSLYLYEPDRSTLLERLVPMYVEISIFRALLESQAAEFGARMTAMDAATRNAKDMISRLSLAYNRARQAAITKELMEIIGGAEALKD
jgi:F-type H+-transporting ATPase subunit gamma